ncbi:trans-sulfuration enzyme family protein [Tepidanaerobacter syntrophicus]|uniref:homocysteine desulfhydrase n=1 Tax=Tepidanaerobacter syntrophicus TaxID=224999 RepID=A0A0U9HH99_9FIRM|nr:PLP-dependent aspartate aminotransferase family protein [Tepidanaerobacter syntrophicus]GAQ25910.1 methionine-gamma-lyase [Tepidanaerobacter syntrophicus]
MKEDFKFETLAVHAGSHPDEKTGALVEPVYMTSTFVFTPDKMERWLAGAPQEDEIIYTYSRSRNPSQVSLQEKIAALEHGEASLVTASGMSAITMAIMGHCKKGDHIISAQTIYGGTFGLFTHVLPEYGIDVTFVKDLTVESLEDAKNDNTKVIYFETIANPTLEIPEFDEIVDWAKKNNIKTVVDNTFTSPYLFKPLDWGIDTVVHSCTKYINGHGDLVGGVVVGSKDFCESLRKTEYMDIGPVPAPLNCYLMTRGLKTLHLRMERHCQNALAFANAMSKHPKIEKVIYPGLESNEYYNRALKYFNGFGGMVSFVINGGIEEAKKVIFSLKIGKPAVSLGDLDTLVEIPAIMTHGKVPKEEREKMGVKDGLIRVSVGIENIDDIICDFEQAFEKI